VALHQPKDAPSRTGHRVQPRQRTDGPCGEVARRGGEDFPLERNTTLGQFWLPGAEEKVVTGLLRIVESDIHIEVSPGLVPMHTFEQMGPGQWSMSTTDDPPDMVALGSIPSVPAASR